MAGGKESDIRLKTLLLGQSCLDPFFVLADCQPATGRKLALVTGPSTGAKSAFKVRPSSAIQTGCVDFVLAPNYIAQKLVGISRHHCLQKGQDKMPGSGPEWAAD
jgi:hypothetical protein